MDMERMIKRNRIMGAIMGLVVGDALGVPVEFVPRAELDRNPVTGMRAYGTYNKPAGTWSDDSSMTLATMDSIIKRNKIDVHDITKRFCRWYRMAEYTPDGVTFDIGNTTRLALEKYMVYGVPRGLDDESSNGNGSLMRVLPVVLCPVATTADIDNVGAITHAHARSKLACRIYTAVIDAIMADDGKKGIRAAIKDVLKADKTGEFVVFDRLPKLCSLSREDIRSSGYVVDTLEAALWCVLNTENYKDCVLLAVNLGNDTDTIAAIAGSIAGALYGVGDIPLDWVATLRRGDYVKQLAAKFTAIVCEG